MKKSEVLIRFHNLTVKQLNHLFSAERELREAGITFDTGFENGREWEFDWSLKGNVEVLHRGFVDNSQEIGSDVVLPDPECRG